MWGGGGYWKRQHQIIYKLKSDIIKTQTHGSYRGQYTRNFKGLFHVKRSLHACIDFPPEFGVNVCKRSEWKSLCFSAFLYQLYQIYIVNLSRKTAFAMSKTFFIRFVGNPFFEVLVVFLLKARTRRKIYITKVPSIHWTSFLCCFYCATKRNVWWRNHSAVALAKSESTNWSFLNLASKVWRATQNSTKFMNF